MPKRPEHPKDICECGDYRQSHALGRGSCAVCRWEYQPLGYPCQRFRLAKRAPLTVEPSVCER